MVDQTTANYVGQNAEAESKAYLLEELYGIKGKQGSWQYRLTMLWLYIKTFFSFLDGAMQVMEYLLICVVFLFIIGAFFYMLFFC